MSKNTNTNTKRNENTNIDGASSIVDQKMPEGKRPVGKNNRFTDIVERENLEELRTKLTTKSAVIRHLYHEGYERGSIATFLNIRYQHVRNVLTQMPKKVTTPPAASTPTVE